MHLRPFATAPLSDNARMWTEQGKFEGFHFFAATRTGVARWGGWAPCIIDREIGPADSSLTPVAQFVS